MIIATTALWQSSKRWQSNVEFFLQNHSSFRSIQKGISPCNSKLVTKTDGWLASGKIYLQKEY